MNYDPPLIPVKLIKRYKRFLADVVCEDGTEYTAHCPNSGRMTGCAGENWPAYISDSQNPKRKLRYTLELTNNGITWIVTNTNHANTLAYEAVTNGLFPELCGYENYMREVKYGEKSRIDILATTEDKKCYIEVKSVTMVNDDGEYCFPDAPTERGRKHLNELMNMVKEGHRAVMLYMIMREDGKGFTPAREIDPAYADLLIEAKENGVELLAYECSVSPTGLSIKGPSSYIRL